MIYLLTETLNCNNQKFYYYTSINTLINNFAISNWQITDDNYRINENILRVYAKPASSGDFSYANAPQVHSVIHTVTQTVGTFTRVYNVTGFVVKSDF